MTSRSAKKPSFIKKVAAFQVRNIVSQFLITCLLLQTLAPVALASPAVAPRGGSSKGLPSSRVVTTTRGFAAGVGTFAAGLFAFVNAALTPQESWNVVLTPVTTEFLAHTGLDYHQPSKKLIVSANSPAGDPHSFELIAGNGTHSAFSNVAGLQGEVLVTAARDDAQGTSLGGFPAGELLSSTGVPAVVARVSAHGASVQNPWVILPEETGHITGLHVDRTGIFGGDLLATTAGGGVWRVNSAGVPTRLAMLGTRLAGVTVVPTDPERYGPWAGKAIVGAKEQASVYAVDAQGQADALEVGINPQDIDIVPAHENFYAIDSTSWKLLGATEGAFARDATGLIHITDLKTGPVLNYEGCPNEHYAFQVRLYALMIEEVEYDARLRLWLDGLMRVEIPWDDTIRDATVEKLQEALSLLHVGESLSAESLAREGPQCLRCRIRPSCATYLRVAPIWWERISSSAPVAPFDVWGRILNVRREGGNIAELELRDAADRTV